MWFKNLLAYRLTADLNLEEDAFAAALFTKSARPCASQELSTYGFVAPFGKGENAPLVHVSGDFMLICAQKEERILPGAVVRDAMMEKVEEIEFREQRKVYKKERDQIKDEIILDLLPRAFIRKSSTFAAIDLKSRLILVNSASAKRAEELLSTVREVIGSLPVRPLCVKAAPAASMTEWVRNQKAADNFYILDKAILADTDEEGGKITANRQDLTSDEIQAHLAKGMQVISLSLAWQDKLSFTLDDKMVIKGIKFDDLLQDQADQDGGDEALGQLDASFLLMMLTFREYLPDLIEALGGEDEPAGI